MNTVPENWIPFVPVRMDDALDPRQIQLQRAAMPRIIEGAALDAQYQRVRPRTVLLREGRDPLDPKTYYIHEEECRAPECASRRLPAHPLELREGLHLVRCSQTNRAWRGHRRSLLRPNYRLTHATGIEKSMGVRGSSIQRVTSHKASSRPALLKN